MRLVKPGTTPLLITAHQHLLQLPVTILQHSISTQSAYNTLVRRWLDFCNRGQLNLHQPTVSQVLGFLHTLYELGISHSAIGTHRSAISAIVEIPGVPQLVDRWLVSPFIKRVFHLRPLQPRYNKTWDFNKVLSYLKSL